MWGIGPAKQGFSISLKRNGPGKDFNLNISKPSWIASSDWLNWSRSSALLSIGRANNTDTKEEYR